MVESMPLTHDTLIMILQLLAKPATLEINQWTNANANATDAKWTTVSQHEYVAIGTNKYISSNAPDATHDDQWKSMHRDGDRDDDDDRTCVTSADALQLSRGYNYSTSIRPLSTQRTCDTTPCAMFYLCRVRKFNRPASDEWKATVN